MSHDYRKAHIEWLVQQVIGNKEIWEEACQCAYNNRVPNAVGKLIRETIEPKSVWWATWWNPVHEKIYRFVQELEKKEYTEAHTIRSGGEVFSFGFLKDGVPMSVVFPEPVAISPGDQLRMTVHFDGSLKDVEVVKKEDTVEKREEPRLPYTVDQLAKILKGHECWEHKEWSENAQSKFKSSADKRADYIRCASGGLHEYAENWNAVRAAIKEVQSGAIFGDADHCCICGQDGAVQQPDYQGFYCGRGTCTSHDPDYDSPGTTEINAIIATRRKYRRLSAEKQGTPEEKKEKTVEEKKLCPRCRVHRGNNTFYRSTWGVNWTDPISVCSCCFSLANDAHERRMRQYMCEHDGHSAPTEYSTDWTPEWRWLQHMDEEKAPEPPKPESTMTCWKCQTSIAPTDNQFTFDDDRHLCSVCYWQMAVWEKRQHGLVPLPKLKRGKTMTLHGCMCPADMFDPRRRR